MSERNAFNWLTVGKGYYKHDNNINLWQSFECEKYAISIVEGYNRDLLKCFIL